MSSPSVGAHLRRLRESRGVSLDEIARATRVSSSYLHALESEDFSSLPAPVFTRGFIRAYCETLGEPADPALTLYDARSDPAPALTEGVTAAPARPAGSRVAAVSEPAPKNRGPLLVSFVLLVVLGVALFAVTLALQSGRDPAGPRTASAPSAPPGTPAVPSGPVPATTAAPPAPAPAAGPPSPGAASSSAVAPGAGPAAVSTPAMATPATPAPAARPEPATVPGASSAAPMPPAGASSAGPPAGAPAGSQPPPRTGGSHRLVARTTEPTWMRVRTEDGRVMEETIPAGQVREWHSSGAFRITVGNAGGVSLELNGRAVPRLGASGAVVPNLVLPAEPQ